MKLMLTAALAIGVLATPMNAQERPKPGPEQARIGYFAGQWKFEGESKGSPMGPPGKISMMETCEWFAGGFHLVCRSEGTTPVGAVTGQAVMGYDPAEQTYTYYAISSVGDGFFVRGHVDGKVWTWTLQSTMEGQTMKFRATITEESPAAYSFRLESSVADGDWMVVEEGRATKQQSS